MLNENVDISPILQTPRLLLRQPVTGDAPFIFSLRSDPRVNKYIDRDPATHPEQAAQFIVIVNQNIARGISFYWSILLKDTSAMIGTICLWNLSDDRRSAELGYELHPDHQGKGYMDEAIKKVTRFAFEKGFTRLEACTHKDNRASTKLLLKNGFLLDNGKKDEVEDNEYWILESSGVGC
jgi:[ribosomal protein S5]-alanine N-acetyltransferase